MADGETSLSQIAKTAIITAFTIAAALIWKDVISDAIQLIFPPQDQLLFKFIAAVLATLLVIVSIYIILKTESEAESVIKRIKERRAASKT